MLRFNPLKISDSYAGTVNAWAQPDRAPLSGLFIVHTSLLVILNCDSNMLVSVGHVKISSHKEADLSML